MRGNRLTPDFEALDERRKGIVAGAAVLGPAFVPLVLADVVDVPSAELSPLLDELADRGWFVAAEAGRLRFAEETLHRQVLDSLPPGRRIEFETQAVHAIRDRFGDDNPAWANALGHHLVAAASRVGGDDMLDRVQHVVAQIGDVAAASALMESALAAADAVGASDTSRAEALITMSDLLRRCGDTAGARTVADDAFDIGVRLGSPQLMADAALARRGDLDPVIEDISFDEDDVSRIDAAIAVCRSDVTLDARMSALTARGALARYWIGDPDEQTAAARMIDDSVDAARRTGDPAVLTRALNARLAVGWGPTYEVAAADIDELEAVAGACTDPDLRYAAVLWKAMGAASRLDSPGLAAVAYELEARTASPSPRARWYAGRWRATAALLAGDLDRAKQLGAQARDIAHGVDRPGLAQGPWMTMVFCCRYLEGRVASLADGAGRLIESTGGAPSWTAGGMLAVAEAGDRARAARALRAIVERPMHRTMTYVTANHLMALLAREVRDVESAAVVAARLEEFSSSVTMFGPANGTVGPVAMALGACAMTVGDPATAADHFAAAAEQSRGTPFGPMAVAELAVAVAADPTSEGPHGTASHLADTAVDAAATVGCEGGVARTLERLDSPSTASRSRRPTSTTATLRSEGETWAVERAGRRATVQALRGFDHLAVLLTRPEQSAHCLELSGAATRRSDTEAPMLDAHAMTEYRSRLLDLQVEIDEAAAAADIGRREKAEAEFDQLTEALAEAVGLSGRTRNVGSGAAERARTSVTKAIRKSIGRIAEVDSEVGRHLSVTIETGYFCTYRPSLDPALSVIVET